MSKGQVMASQSLIWRSGKKELLRIESVEERCIVVPTRCTADELDALATAAKEAARVMREAAANKKDEKQPS